MCEDRFLDKDLLWAIIIAPEQLDGKFVIPDRRLSDLIFAPERFVARNSQATRARTSVAS